MSHFAHKVLGKQPLRAVYGKSGFLQGHEPAQPTQFELRASVRLLVWTPGNPEEIRAGKKGWLPVLIAGTTWDEQQLRLQFKAKNVCTLFIKAGLETNAS